MTRSLARCLQLVALICVLTLASHAGGAGAAVTARPGGPLALPTGSYFGALVNPDRSTPSSTQAEVTALETRIGRKLDIVNRFYRYPETIGTAEAEDVAAGRIPMVTWGATDTDAIVNGSEDAYITQQAKRLAALGKPVLLRYFHEPEGAYRAPLTNNDGSIGADDAQKYVAAWRHAYDLFQAAGATNVVWVFCTTAFSFRSPQTVPPQAYYPGDDVVDWIAGDGYNFAPVKPGAKWNTPATVFGRWYSWASSPAADSSDRYVTAKPLMLGEYGALEDPSIAERKATWYEQLRSTVKTSFPLVQAVLAWSTTNTKNGLVYNWNVDSTASALSAWRAMSQDAYFRPSG